MRRTNSERSELAKELESLPAGHRSGEDEVGVLQYGLTCDVGAGLESCL